jgi:hypothetical protein
MANLEEEISTLLEEDEESVTSEHNTDSKELPLKDSKVKEQSLEDGMRSCHDSSTENEPHGSIPLEDHLQSMGIVKKAKKCYRCRAEDHLFAQCPLVTDEEKQIKRRSSSRRGRQNKHFPPQNSIKVTGLKKEPGVKKQMFEVLELLGAQGCDIARAIPLRTGQHSTEAPFKVILKQEETLTTVLQNAKLLHLQTGWLKNVWVTEYRTGAELNSRTDSKTKRQTR